MSSPNAVSLTSKHKYNALSRTHPPLPQSELCPHSLKPSNTLSHRVSHGPAMAGVEFDKETGAVLTLSDETSLPKLSPHAQSWPGRPGRTPRRIFEHNTGAKTEDQTSRMVYIPSPSPMSVSGSDRSLSDSWHGPGLTEKKEESKRVESEFTATTPESYIDHEASRIPGHQMIAYLVRVARQGLNGAVMSRYPPVCHMFPANFCHDLHDAVMKGDLAAIKHAVASGANPNQYCGPMRTSELHWAVMHGNDDVVHTLVVDCGADIHYKPGITKSDTVVAAVCYGNLSTLKLVLQLGARPNYRIPLPWWTRFLLSRYHKATAIHVAACFGNHEMVRVLLEMGGNPQARNSMGMEPIKFCKDDDNGRACKALFSAAVAARKRSKLKPSQDTPTVKPHVPEEQFREDSRQLPVESPPA